MKRKKRKKEKGEGEDDDVVDNKAYQRQNVCKITGCSEAAMRLMKHYVGRWTRRERKKKRREGGRGEGKGGRGEGGGVRG